MIAQIVQSGNGGTISNPTFPAGWTIIAGSDIYSQTNDRCRVTLLYKVATASDVAATNFSFTFDADADDGEGAIVAFSGVDVTTGPFDVTPGTVYTNIASDNTLNANTITTVTANSAVIMFGAIYNNFTLSGWTTINPGNLTELYDVPFDATMDIGMGAAWALKSSTGATGGGTATLSTGDDNGSILIALRPLLPPTITSFPANGCVGTSFTIIGTNLSGATSVTIGGTNATITANNSTSVTVTVGSGTTGTIAVTTPGGTATSVSQFTVLQLPGAAGEITGSTSVCPNTTGLTYSISPVANATSYTWSVVGSGWSLTGVQGTTTMTVTSGFAGTNATISVTPSNSCGNGTQSTLSVSAKSNPTRPASITGNIAPCQGSSQSYSVISVAGNTYNWTVPADWAITAGQGSNSVTVTVGSLGGNVSVIASNGCSNATARDLAVTPILGAPAQPSAITGPASSCPGSSNITYSVTNVPGVTYTWAYSNPASVVFNSGQGTNTISINYTAGAIDGTWTVTPSNACGSGTPSTLSVTMGSGTTASLSGPIVVCQGSTYTYTTDPGKSSYGWTISTNGGTGSSTTNTIDITWGQPGTQWVQASYNDGSGCTSYSVQYQVTVNPMPIPTVTGPSTMCAGTGGYVYTTEPGMTNYLWTVSPADQLTSGGGTSDNTVTVTWNTGGPQSVAVNYTNSYLCTRPVAIQEMITVYPLPAPTVTGPPSVCAGTSGNVYITESGMTNYIWSVSSGGTITSGGTSTENTITVAWNAEGAQTVSVRYTNSFGCTLSSSYVYNVTVHGLTTATLTGPTAVCSGATGNVYTTGSGMTQYVWSVSGGGTITSGGGSSDNSVTVTWNTAGPQNVSVRFNDPYSCPAAVFNLPVTVTQFSSAAIDYTGSPFCLTDTNVQPVSITGTANYLGGTYSASPAGLSIDPSTGSITPSLSTGGTFTVTYTKPPSGGCAAINTTTIVIITTPPYATIYYAGNPFCSNPGAINVTRTGSGGGTYSATPVGLSLDALTGAVNYTTSAPGNYIVTYLIGAGGGCGTFETTANISINKLALPTFHYSAVSYCQSSADPSPIHTGGGVDGTSTAVPTGLVINASTGVIDLSASTPGIYYVTNSISGSGPCPPVTATNQVEISAVSNATISYPLSAYCSDAGIINVNLFGNIGGTYSATPSGLSIDPSTGAVNTNESLPNTYTVTYTITGGCGTFSTTTQLTINLAPLAITGTSGGACDGASTQLGTAPIRGHTYSWTSNPVGFTSTSPIRLSSPTVPLHTTLQRQ